MFTIKQCYAGSDNYHAWSARSYYINKDAPSDAKPGDAVNPKISMELADGVEAGVAVVGTVYIENAAGKTIDVIKPFFVRGQSPVDSAG